LVAAGFSLRFIIRNLKVAATVTVTMVLLLGTVPNTAFASQYWISQNWQKRIPITINNGGTALTDYQVWIATSEFSSAQWSDIKGGTGQSDLDDVRFTKPDKITPLNYWIDSDTNNPAGFWVKVPSVPAGDSTVYFYYGNNSAGAGQSGDDTFEFFDDFEDGVLNTTTKWTTFGSGTFIEEGGNLYIEAPDDLGWSGIRTKSSFGHNYISEYQIEFGGNLGDCGSYYHGFYDASEGIPPSSSSPNPITALPASIKHVGFGEGWQNGYEQANGTNREGTAVSGGNAWTLAQIKWYGDGAYFYTLRPDGTDYSGTLLNYSPTDVSMDMFFGVCDIYWYGVSYDSARLWIYNVKIRKYAATEPTVSSVGTAEAVDTVDPVGTQLGAYHKNAGGSWLSSADWNDDVNPDVKIQVQDSGSGLRVNQTEIAPSSGCVLMMHFNEGSGTTIYDTSGYGNNGALTASTGSWTTGKFGNAYNFNGFDEYVNISDFPNQNKKVTIIAWIKQNEYISGRRAGGASQRYEISLEAGYYSLRVYGSGGNTFYHFSDTANPSDYQGKWVFLAASIDSDADKIVGYINGRKQKINTDIRTDLYETGSGVIYIARYSNGGYFNGIIDEVGIWNRALTAEEIAAMYNSSCVKYSTDNGSSWTIEPSTSVVFTCEIYNVG